MTSASPDAPAKLRGLRACKAHRGFTLLEVLLVVAMITILTAMGFSQVREMMPRFRTRRAASEFAAAIADCRMYAIQTNLECRILMVNYDENPDSTEAPNVGEYWVQIGNSNRNSDSWDTLPMDTNEDETDDDKSTGEVAIGLGEKNQLKFVSIMQWETIEGPGSDNNDALVFGPSGMLINPDDDFGDQGYIVIRFVNKVAYSDGVEDIEEVNVARSGMVRIDNALINKYEGLSAGIASGSTGD